jgi:hypothetical protein
LADLFADMVLIKTLLETPDLPEWEERFKEKATERFPFDSLSAVVQRLAQSQAPVAKDLDALSERLEAHVVRKWPPQAGEPERLRCVSMDGGSTQFGALASS